MSQVLTESQLIELISKPLLPFLDEYLILSDGIALKKLRAKLNVTLAA